MHSIVMGYRRPKALRASAVRPSSISRRGVRRTRGVGRVGGHETALRDHSFLIASQRFEDAMRQSRSGPFAGRRWGWLERAPREEGADDLLGSFPNLKRRSKPSIRGPPSLAP